MKAALFLDRDGTIIESVHYLNCKEQVVVLPKVVRALRELQSLGFLLIIVTNQAAIKKGLLSLEGLEEIQNHLSFILEKEGVKIDDWYFSPEAMIGKDREVVEFRNRKPGPGMLLDAAEEHNIDLSKSWMIGDMLSDTLAGRNAKVGSTILLTTGLSSDENTSHYSVDFIARTMLEAKEIILNSMR